MGAKCEQDEGNVSGGTLPSHLNSDTIAPKTAEHGEHEQELAFSQWLEHNVEFQQHAYGPNDLEQQLAT